MFFAGKKGKVEPSTTNRFSNSRLWQDSVVVQAPPASLIGSVPA